MGDGVWVGGYHIYIYIYKETSTQAQMGAEVEGRLDGRRAEPTDLPPGSAGHQRSAGHYEYDLCCCCRHFLSSLLLLS